MTAIKITKFTTVKIQKNIGASTPRGNNYKKNIGKSTPNVSRDHKVFRHGNAIDWRTSASSQVVRGTSVWTGRERRDCVPDVASGWGDLRHTRVNRLAG